jgi:hypothetical protein
VMCSGANGYIEREETFIFLHKFVVQTTKKTLVPLFFQFFTIFFSLPNGMRAMFVKVLFSRENKYNKMNVNTTLLKSDSTGSQI